MARQELTPTYSIMVFFRIRPQGTLKHVVAPLTPAREELESEGEEAAISPR